MLCGALGYAQNTMLPPACAGMTGEQLDRCVRESRFGVRAVLRERNQVSELEVACALEVIFDLGEQLVVRNARRIVEEREGDAIGLVECSMRRALASLSVVGCLRAKGVHRRQCRGDRDRAG